MSATSDFLITHAVKNVWCSPDQDQQYILRPQRITRPEGTRKDVEVMWEKIPLPTATDWYHVFQIGELDPTTLGLNGRLMSWVSLEQHCNAEQLFADVYNKAGIQVPKFLCHFLVLLNGMMVVAIRHVPELANFGKEDVYLRFYSNSYFEAPNPGFSKGIDVAGYRPADLNSRNVVINRHNNMIATIEQIGQGHVFCYINGRLVRSINSQTLAVGDYVELVLDLSVKDYHEFKVSELDNFVSELDKKQKYLVHYDGKGETIEYRDDVEMYLIRRTNENVFQGVLYHRNVEDAVRMVTHKDYSIPTQYVAGYLEDNPWLGQTEEIGLRLYLRHSGYRRPLVFEHHRIHELYKLPDGDVVDAMIGNDSTVPEWQARNLELSGYTAIMRHTGNTIPLELVQSAYGYNSISKIVGDTPQHIKEAGGWVELPAALRNASTVFEYDKDGVLIGWRNHGNGRYYTPRSLDCRMIEAVVGRGSTKMSTAYNADLYTLQDGVNYRMYARRVNGGLAVTPWQDVTDNTEFYVVINGQVEWKVSQNDWETAIKNDVDIACYDLTLSYRDGINRFTINTDEIRTDGLSHPNAAEIPFGSFRIWLNGRSLIQDLDYIIQWPEIVVVNKKYLSGTGTERFLFLGMGFCQPDMTMLPPKDHSFIKHGRLSKNKRYDIRDDKVVRIVIDGCVYARDELLFGEDPVGAVSVTDVQNGLPYVVDDVIVPLRGLVNEDTYTLRAKSLEVDKRVEDYLTAMKPEPQEETPNIIPELYQIYSPFASKITHDLAQGLLRMDNFQSHYNDQQLKAACEPYLWLLEYDPCFSEKIDLDYVSIHPHNERRAIILDVYQWRFLNRAIKYFLKGRVNISKFIKIESGFEHETDDHPHPYAVAPQ